MINVGLFIKKDKVFESGINTDDGGGTSNRIIDYTKTWNTNQWLDYYIRIIEGTGVGYYFKCTSNSVQRLDFDSLPFNLDTTSVYEIYTQVSERVELFQDEKISVTSSIQNANDLGKLFTDYSQSFTIPASKNNNAIFSHWYENSVNDGYDHRKRYDAYIELDTVPFRKGKIQIEKANKKNGFIENYTITFYGNLTQLKDLFKEDKINQLDYSDIAFEYVPAGVLAVAQSDTTPDFKFPIFGNDKQYRYLSGLTGDLTTSNILDYRDLFPAIKVKKIFQYIQTKYNIIFTGSFFDTIDFTDLFLELKNTEKMVAYVEPSFLLWDLFPEENIEYPLSWAGSTLPTNTVSLKLSITPTELSVPYKVEIYKDGFLYKTYNLVGDKSGVRALTFYPTITKAADGVDSLWKIKVTAEKANTFNASIIKSQFFNGVSSTTTTNNIPEAGGNILDIKRYCPDITVNAFVTGIIKQFNLMIVPISATEFNFETLEVFYNSGDILPMTEYFNADELTIDKPILYKKLTFKYEKSENIINNSFRNLVSRGFDYGDLNYENVNSNESQNYEVSLPFECCMFDRALDTSGVLTPFISTSFINKDVQAYLPKPFLFYWIGVKSLPTPIRMVRNDAGDYYSLSTYNAFSSDNLDNKSLTFNNEISSWDYEIKNGLYENYYSKYVANLYKLKTRMITIKAILPITKITEIKLNDRIVIGDKRYIINTMVTDLTSGECTFNLITDYRKL